METGLQWATSPLLLIAQHSSGEFRQWPRPPPEQLQLPAEDILNISRMQETLQAIPKLVKELTALPKNPYIV